MIIFLYTLIFTAFLNECNGTLGGGCFAPSTTDDFDIDEFEYQGDFIRFACITTESQDNFDITDVNGIIPSDLVDRLNNGKGLSLFFHGVSYMIDPLFDSLFYFAKQWFEASRNNICVVSYAYTTPSTEVLKIYAIVNKMIKTRRLEYVAKMARDLVFGVRGKCLATTERTCLRNFSQVDVTGFSFGAHIAGRTCQYLLQKTHEKVRMLLALDPIKTPRFGPKIKDSIKKGDADYVQVVHTSKKVGMWDQMGDVDIYVKYEKQKNMGSLNDEHGVAFFIHLGTSTNRLYMWARENGNGSVWTQKGKALHDECTIGVYGILKSQHRGKKLGLWLAKRNAENFWEGIGSFNLAEQVLPPQEILKEEEIAPENECGICFRNKKNARLNCACKNPEICMTCWNEWKSKPTSQSKCPICRQKVTSAKRVN
ncbi:phospholipase A1 1-like [Contarinia nasturtii]|uniref:phospholipase A1 1-like n=1 Tax=Contarinia nasturtii TaxID=265458 RepID=UPI0012D3ADF8|nr:phospholipase A1 1-like [Contarinia nasturtii]